MKEKLQLIYINKEKLQKLEGNPRKQIDENGTEKLRLLIRKHGFQNPLQVFKEGDKYTIICGNHRFDAGLLEGISEFPCLEYVGTKEEAIARAISDNKSNEWTDWDMPKLTEELGKLDIDEFDMELTGFSASELSEILDVEEDFSEEDAAPEVVTDKPAVTQMGDLWTLGKHRLLCGDATNQEDVNRLMNGTKASMVFTDPPYGMNLDTDFTGISRVCCLIPFFS